MAEQAKKIIRFVKVCPFCFSPKLSVRFFDVGYYYDCTSCGEKNFYPLEFDADKVKDLKINSRKKVVKKKLKKAFLKKSAEKKRSRDKK